MAVDNSEYLPLASNRSNQILSQLGLLNGIANNVERQRQQAIEQANINLANARKSRDTNLKDLVKGSYTNRQQAKGNLLTQLNNAANDARNNANALAIQANNLGGQQNAVYQGLNQIANQLNLGEQNATVNAANQIRGLDENLANKARQIKNDYARANDQYTQNLNNANRAYNQGLQQKLQSEASLYQQAMQPYSTLGLDVPQDLQDQYNQRMQQAYDIDTTQKAINPTAKQTLANWTAPSLNNYTNRLQGYNSQVGTDKAGNLVIKSYAPTNAPAGIAKSSQAGKIIKG